MDYNRSKLTKFRISSYSNLSYIKPDDRFTNFR